MPRSLCRSGQALVCSVSDAPRDVLGGRDPTAGPVESTWIHPVRAACELVSWMQMLALAGETACGNRTGSACASSTVRAGWRAEPPPAARARRALALALGRRGHRRDHPPAGPPIWLTNRNRHYDREGETKARGTPPTRRDGRTARHDRTLKSAPSQCLRPRLMAH